MKIHQLLSRKSLFSIAGIVLLYTITGFFLVPYFARNVLQDKLGQALNRPVEIKKVLMNPYALSVTLKELVIKGKNNDDFLSVQRLYGNLSITSLFMFSPVLSDISVDSPYINITRHTDGIFNFSDLLEDPSNKASKSKVSPEADNAEKSEFYFVLKKAAINQGRILFKDGLEKTNHEIKDLNFSLASLSNKSEKRYEAANLDVAFVLNGTLVNIHAESTPFAEDLFTRATINTENIDALHYLSYLPVPGTLKLEDIDLNLFLNGEFRKIKDAFSLVVQGSANALNTDIKNNQNENILNLPSLSIELGPSDILDGKVNLSSIVLSSPEMDLSRDTNGELSLIKHIPESKFEQNEKPVNEENKQDQAMAKLGDKPLLLTLGLLEIKDARISFKDSSNPTLFETTVYPFNFKIENLQAGKDISGNYAFNLATRQKEIIQSNGNFGLLPFKAKGKLELSGIDSQHYEPYYEKMVDLSVKKGRLDLTCDFDLFQNKNTVDGIIENKLLKIKDLEVFEGTTEGQTSGKEMIAISEFVVRGSKINMGGKEISTGEIFSKKGSLHMKRLEHGLINIIKSTMPGQVEDRQSKNSMPENKESLKESKLKWSVNVNTLDIEDYKIVFNDFSTNDPVEIVFSNVGIHADNLQTTESGQGNISAKMNWNKAGRISVSGSLDLANQNGAFDIDLDTIDIKSLQPYFTDTVKILVTSGDIHTKGKVKLQLKQKKDKIRFEGGTSVTDFICLDKKSAQDFFKCKSLYVSDINFSSPPIVLEAQDISLTDFYSRIIVNDVGEINVAGILEKEGSKEEASKKEVPVQEVQSDLKHIPQIKIANVTLQGGNINFSDYFTKPNFTADMKELTGAVSGLSSEPETRAKLHLQGIHGESSPLEIVGDINPLAEKKYMDIDISYKDIELTNFTPYAAKFLGYKIEKGKLILDLEYTIDGTSLKSENRARFDNFTLGESVDSEHATSLPVSLAISLLKDRDGQINLDLPVTGELNDPEFSIAGIIFKMIGNLILKAAASPFSILGAMFGGGEDLGYVEFEFGTAQIDTLNLEKLDTLVKILEKKPSISLEIKGMYHPEHDAENLRIKGYYDLLKAQKIQDMVKTGNASGTLEEVELSEDEIKEYVERAYADATFPKPRDAEGKEKKIELQEKIKLLRTNVKVTEGDLRLLAMNRSKTIKTYIISRQTVDRERVFIIEPGELEDSEQSSMKSEARFSLKEN